MFEEKLMNVLGRGLAVWVAIAVVESVNGTLRRLLLEPMVGDWRARQISVFTGSVLICVVTFIFVRWIKASNALDLVLVGLMWVVLTVLFEICLGRLARGLSWERIMSDYDLPHGGLMVFGLLVMMTAPLIAGKLLDEV